MIRVTFTRNTGPTGMLLAGALQGSPLQGHVNWTGGNLEGALNGLAFTNKLRQLGELKEGGVKVPEFTLPLEAWPRLAPVAGWLPRTALHRGGRDFRRRNIVPDFWVEPLELSEEWRVHIFRTKKDNMRVLRCAKKVAEGPNAHPWIRNHDYGWRFSYVEGCWDQLKEQARNAIRVLKLDFGAVDLGLTPEGEPYVLEVNTCPGLEEGNTLRKYAENIIERLTV